MAPFWKCTDLTNASIFVFSFTLIFFARTTLHQPDLWLHSERAKTWLTSQCIFLLVIFLFSRYIFRENWSKTGATLSNNTTSTQLMASFWACKESRMAEASARGPADLWCSCNTVCWPTRLTGYRTGPGTVSAISWRTAGLMSGSETSVETGTVIVNHSDRYVVDNAVSMWWVGGYVVGMWWVGGRCMVGMWLICGQ